MEKKLTLMDRILYFMEGRTGGVATLKEIYNDVKAQFESSNEEAPNFLKDKVRCVIYRDKKNRLKRVTKGVYLYTGENTAGLILHGDGRKLEEIEDNSIDTIITDHPWSDKKAHRSGNQKNFAAEYENNCFRYTVEDFKEKYRVLKEGGYLIEFLPTESNSNYKYLMELKNMANEVGFEYYAKLMWMKAPEGSINTGRTTKGTEDILIMTKGKPRRLNPIESRKPYFTKEILAGRLDIPAPKPKEKRHQAEKPVSVYSYLIENTTEEGDVCLDQFGGSLNLIEAAVKKNRFAVVYEYLSKFVHAAVNRLGALPLFISEKDKESLDICKNNKVEYMDLDEILGHIPENTVVCVDIANEPEKESLDEVATEAVETEKVCTKKEWVKDIPSNISEFQLNLLKNMMRLKKELLEDNEAEIIVNADILKEEDRLNINAVFNRVYENAYANHYNRLNVDLDILEEATFRKNQECLKNIFEEKIKNEFIRVYYKNYLIEAEDFVKFMIKKKGFEDIEEIRNNSLRYIDEYLNLVSSHKSFKNKKIIVVKTMIMKLMA